jgi:signal transduction histidine kinase
MPTPKEGQQLQETDGEEERVELQTQAVELLPGTDYMGLASAAKRLRFQKDIELSYKKDYHTNTIHSTRLAFTAGFIMYAIFGILDVYVAPFSLHKVWLIRFGIGCPVLLFTLLFSFVKRYAAYMQLVASLAAVIAGLGVDAIIQVTRPGELAHDHYYSGIILVLLFTSAWLRLRFWYALAANTAMILGYELVVIYSDHLLRSDAGRLQFLSNNFLIIGSYIIALFTNYSLELHTRMDFLQRRTIEAEKNKVNDQRLALEQQAAQLAKAVASLRKTQTRLVHSEKLASLGELTAGIAHEIKNPLNFVTNFSELSTELLVDLEAAAAAGNSEETTALVNDIKDNLQKIAYHGKRADSIVKSMLLHSSKGTGQKEPTIINALTDEYLRLSYQGWRAKDKEFNAFMETDFDEGIDKVNVVAQDIGRVLLNLFTNAFYSVYEKKKISGNEYKPTVTVQTERGKSSVTIRVRDNGMGISKKAMNKLFQPFFTTKPTGEGVGLGLSLSHDIITKGHGGTMNVESVEGEYAQFTITLPLAV